MILTAIGWLAALVAALTGLAMLQDAHRTPADTSPRGWLRHVLRLALLIGITASAVVLLILPAARPASLYEVALRCCLTGFMAMQSPCPWWRYVFRGHPLGAATPVARDACAISRQDSLMNNRQLAFCLIVCATFAVFAVLKLAHIITWSWWWITAPLWGGLVLLVILLLWFLIALTIAASSGKPI